MTESVRKQVWVEVFSSSDWVDVPRFGMFSIGKAMIARLNRLSQLCADEGLCEVREMNAIDQFGLGLADEEPRIAVSYLVITATDCWFEAIEKHSDTVISTRSVPLERLRAIEQGRCNQLDWYAASDSTAERELEATIEEARLEAFRRQGEICALGVVEMVGPQAS